MNILLYTGSNCHVIKNSAGVHRNIITYYIPSAKFFIGIFFANERKHP
jgi:hypothetical protein